MQDSNYSALSCKSASRSNIVCLLRCSIIWWEVFDVEFYLIHRMCDFRKVLRVENI